MKSWFEIKVRAVLGTEENDDKEVSILGRLVRWTGEGIKYEADPKHRRLVLEYFGFNSQTKPSGVNGERGQSRRMGGRVFR
eukprot:3690945-Karenia_brevis.AAC.1